MQVGRLTRRAAIAAGTMPLLTRALFAQELRTIVVGGVTVEDSLPLWYGMQAGLFRRAGLNVDYQRVASGSAAAQGIIGGAFNIGNTNTLAGTLAHARGIAIHYITFGGMYVGGTDYISSIVKKEATFQTGADLNGKIHGTTGVKDLNSLAVSAWVDEHGGDSKTLKIVEIPYPAIGAAVEEGRVDIGTLIQPFLGASLADGKLRTFANTYSAISTRFALSGWGVMAPWAEQNADTVRRFVRVIRDCNVYVNAHKVELAPLLAQNSGALLDTILRSGRATFSETFAEPVAIQPLIDVAAKYQAIPQRFDANDLISPTVKGLR